MTGRARLGRMVDGVAEVVGGRFRFGFAVVKGDSMRPTLTPGDRLLVRYGARPRPWDVVVARFADGTVVVKRAVELRPDGWWLLGDAAPHGVDSRHRGAVPAADILGVVVLQVAVPPKRLRRRPRG